MSSRSQQQQQQQQQQQHNQQQQQQRKGTDSTTETLTVPYGSLDNTSTKAHHHHHPAHHHHRPSLYHEHYRGPHADNNNTDIVSFSSNIQHPENGGGSNNSEEDDNNNDAQQRHYCLRMPSLRRIALKLSLWLNIIITISKLVAYLQTFSLSVLAALLDSVLDVVSQVVLNYTEKHSTMQRSSAFYPAGASRLEPIGVLTCAALMGMASFEVLKESTMALADQSHHNLQPNLSSFYNMSAIVLVKLGLLWLCNKGANKKRVLLKENSSSNRDDGLSMHNIIDHRADADAEEEEEQQLEMADDTRSQQDERMRLLQQDGHDINNEGNNNIPTSKHVVQLADPTLEALAQDHWNDALSNGVAAVALLFAVREPSLWFLDPIGAILISIYIIYSWYMTGKEQIEHLTGKSAPDEFIEELKDLANVFDERIVVDTVRAYHFGPKFLVEIEIVMDSNTLLFESHDLGMDLQYEIEGREEVERCFVHIDYQTRPYDEHVVSKVPELLEKYVKQPSYRTFRSTKSV